MKLSGEHHDPAALPQGKEHPGYHWTEDWVSPEVSGRSSDE
jgi:hypothetical protein